MMPFPGAPHAVPAGQGQAVPGDQIGQIERLDLGQRPVKDGGQIGHHVFGANSSIMAVIILRSEDDMKKPRTTPPISARSSAPRLSTSGRSAAGWKCAGSG
jgi:hypothetical protein